MQSRRLGQRQIHEERKALGLCELGRRAIAPASSKLHFTEQSQVDHDLTLEDERVTGRGRVQRTLVGPIPHYSHSFSLLRGSETCPLCNGATGLSAWASPCWPPARTMCP